MRRSQAEPSIGPIGQEPAFVDLDVPARLLTSRRTRAGDNFAIEPILFQAQDLRHVFAGDGS
jgi:hypothetical protein